MKIGILTRYSPPTIDGVGDYSAKLAKTLAELGHEVRIYTGNDQAKVDETVYPVLDFDQAASIPGMIAETWEGFKGHLLFQYVPQAFGRYGLAYAASGIPKLLHEKLGCPVTVTVHEHGVDWKPGFKSKILTVLMRMQTRKLFKGCETVITTCERYAESLKPYAGNAKISMIPVGANTEFFRASAEELNRLRTRYELSEKKVMGVYGRLSAFRNTIVSVRALKSALDQGVPAKLLLIGNMEGSHKPYFDRLMREAESLGVHREMVVTGHLSERDVSKHLQLVDVFLFPQVDGVSTRNTTVISALEHELPIISYEPFEGNFPKDSMAGVICAPRENESQYIEASVEALRETPRLKEGDFLKFSWKSIAGAYMRSWEAS